MNAKMLSGIVILLMLTASMPVLADGPWIHVPSYKDGDILTVRTINLTGTARPSPDQWYQHTVPEFKAGSMNNMTLTKDGVLTVKPYIGEFQKNANNPIIDLGAVGSVDEFGTQLGAIIQAGATYKMWAMVMDNSSVYHLEYLDSNDGLSWDTQNSSLDLGGPGAFDQMAIWPGTVITDGATYKMWYVGVDPNQISTIGYATSSDGLTWTKGNNGKPVLDLGPVNKFDGGSVVSPSVIKDGDTYKMWYAGMISYSNNLYQIGYATSTDGVTWTRENNGEPVLSFGKSNTFDSDGLYGTAVIKDGETYRMWYLGIPGRSAGIATSSDGVNWAKENGDSPVLQGDSGKFDSAGIMNLGVFRVGNKYELYYTGLDAMLAPRIGLAEANLEGLTGIFQSDIFVGEFPVDWNEVSVTTNTPIGTTASVSTRSSNDRVDWNAWAPLVDGKNAWKNAKFMQYMVTLTSSDGITIPTLGAINLEFEAIERVEVSTDNNTWFIATGTNSWNTTLYLNEGPNKLYVRIVDTTPRPTYLVMNLIVDTIKPTAILQVNNNAMYTTNTSVHLSISAADARGVVKMRLATSLADLQNQSWQDYLPALDYKLPAIDGLVTLYGQVKDTTGWTSNVFSSSIILDATPPEATVVINGNAPITTQLKVSLGLTATDVNRVTDMRVSNDPDLTGIDWKPYAQVMDWQLTEGDGLKTIYVEFRDSAGNAKVFSGSIQLVTKVPTGSIVINNGDAITTDRVVTLTLNATDKNGISYVMLSNEPDFLVSLWVRYNKTMTWTLPETMGPQTVYAKLKNIAGLVSQVVSDNIILDIHEEGFQGSLNLDNGDQYTNNQTLTAKLDLMGGDVQSMMMLSESPDFTGATWVPFAASTTYTTQKTDGAVTVYAKFKDRYGMTSNAVSDSIIIDTAAPTVTILKPTMNAKVDTATVTIVGTASDNYDLRTVEVQLPNGAWMPVDNPKSFSLDVYLPAHTTYTIAVRATDAAGNVGTSTVVIKYAAAQSTGFKIPGFETGALIIAVLVIALVLMRRKRN
jgi:predicted GH43/DUF377 family glycosyl hydrolase